MTSGPPHYSKYRVFSSMYQVYFAHSSKPVCLSSVYLYSASVHFLWVVVISVAEQAQTTPKTPRPGGGDAHGGERVVKGKGLIQVRRATRKRKGHMQVNGRTKVKGPTEVNSIVAVKKLTYPCCPTFKMTAPPLNNKYLVH